MSVMGPETEIEDDDDLEEEEEKETSADEMPENSNISNIARHDVESRVVPGVIRSYGEAEEGSLISGVAGFCPFCRRRVEIFFALRLPACLHPAAD